MIVAGVDPGTLKLGLGILDCERGRPPRYRHAEVISAASHWNRTARLLLITSDYRQAIAEFNPEALGLELAYIGKNPMTGLALGEARGLAITHSGVEASRIRSWESARWKHAIGLAGNADKPQIQTRMRFLLHLSRVPAEDAADALGIAWATAAFLRLI